MSKVSTLGSTWAISDETEFNKKPALSAPARVPELGYSRSSLRLRSSRRCVKLHGRSRTDPGATVSPVSGTGDERLQAHTPICAFLAHVLPTARLALRTPP